MKNLKNLNSAKQLSKNEQLNIKGGAYHNCIEICPERYYCEKGHCKLKPPERLN